MKIRYFYAAVVLAAMFFCFANITSAQTTSVVEQLQALINNITNQISNLQAQSVAQLSGGRSPIEITSPNSSTTCAVGQTCNITWNSSLAASYGIDKIDIDLVYIASGSEVLYNTYGWWSAPVGIADNIIVEDLSVFQQQYTWTMPSTLRSGNYALFFRKAGRAYEYVAHSSIFSLGCTPNWQCTAWSYCFKKVSFCTGDLCEKYQIRDCTDKNNCGVITGKPITTQDCPLDCTPNWQCGDWGACQTDWSGISMQIRTCTNINSCSYSFSDTDIQSRVCDCTPNWQCTAWGDCGPSASFPGKTERTRTCADINNCILQPGSGSSGIGMPETTQICSCTPNWQCTSWGACLNNQQVRKCVDLNGCNVADNKPSEMQMCGLTCNPNWWCDNWSQCGLGQIQQTRTCSDLNFCNTNTGKPAEARNCPVVCTPDWQCSAWEDHCADGYRSRQCSDKNNCGTTVGMPYATQSCAASCVPDWHCGDWGTCINSQQSRSCTDYNSCGVSNGKPEITQSCQSTVTCTPNWECSSWSTCTNYQQTRTCTDKNNCGVATNKPITAQYCKPGVCTPDWQCSAWGACKTGGYTTGDIFSTYQYQERTCADKNNCRVATNKPVTTQVCPTTCTPNWHCGSWRSCKSGSQTRTCNDTNNCGVTTNKPAETQSCICVPSWQCKAWTGCINGQMSRTCFDAYFCAGPESEQAALQQELPKNPGNIRIETQSCTGAACDWGCGDWGACVNNQQKRICGGYCWGETKPAETQPCVACDWHCTGWSSCVNNQQTRTCTNPNNCNTAKPAETQQCYNINWQCTAWSECINNYYKTRTCTEVNNCSDSTSCIKALSKPNETEVCPNWQCKEWSICLFGQQARDCYDSYGIAKMKKETKPCCFPHWQCTAWSACVGGIHNRTCTDSNNCTGYEKPVESFACDLSYDTSWSCSEWSDCVNNRKTRVCYDYNNYYGTQRPEESMACTAVCVPKWDCDNWSSCEKGEQSTRRCTDLNACDRNLAVKTETKVCGYPCTPEWDIRAWSMCVNGTQTRTVYDKNYCQEGRYDPATKPVIARSCSACTPNWQCTEWGDCVIGVGQKRTCIDTNNCDLSTITTPKPAELQGCSLSCTADWQCSAWGNCFGSGMANAIQYKQTRQCIDANNCGWGITKPSTSQSCLCVPDWHCSEWSSCFDNYQRRTCKDANNCMLENNKPSEREFCGISSCTPRWQCSEWGKCEDDCPSSSITSGICAIGKQTRACTDLNNCKDVPPFNQRSCTPCLAKAGGLANCQQPDVKLTSPGLDAAFSLGNVVPIKWSTLGLGNNIGIKLFVTNPSASQRWEITADQEEFYGTQGNNPIVVPQYIDNTGSFNWKIPQSGSIWNLNFFEQGSLTPDKYKIEIYINIATGPGCHLKSEYAYSPAFDLHFCDPPWFWWQNKDMYCTCDSGQFVGANILRGDVLLNYFTIYRSNDFCTPNWQCVNDGGGTRGVVVDNGPYPYGPDKSCQPRKCTDLNNCTYPINKPAETPPPNCEAAPYQLKWQCTEWSDCQNRVQTRTCTDVNYCGGGDLGKPDEIQYCSDEGWCHVFAYVGTDIGVDNSELSYLQKAIKKEGIDTGNDTWYMFTSTTVIKNAIRKFQEKYASEILTPIGLTKGTGKAGPATVKKLNELYTCSKTICKAKWLCTPWSDCVNGVQTRSCVDDNKCGVTLGKPNTTKTCSTECVPGWQEIFCPDCDYGKPANVYADTSMCGVAGNCIPSWVCPCNSTTNLTENCYDSNKCGVSQTPPASQLCGCSISEICHQTTECINGQKTFSCISTALDCKQTTTTKTEPCGIPILCNNPDWQCTAWSACSNGSQTRICTDFKKCGILTGKPIEKRQCPPAVGKCQSWWGFSEWTNCLNGKQYRYLVDNTCGEAPLAVDEEDRLRNCGPSIQCAPQWVCTDWFCSDGRKDIRKCVDMQGCATTDKPLQARSPCCASNWRCTDWSRCIGGKRTRTCVDMNSCGDTTHRPSETYTCTALDYHVDERSSGYSGDPCAIAAQMGVKLKACLQQAATSPSTQFSNSTFFYPSWGGSLILSNLTTQPSSSTSTTPTSTTTEPPLNPNDGTVFRPYPVEDSNIPSWGRNINR